MKVLTSMIISGIIVVTARNYYIIDGGEVPVFHVVLQTMLILIGGYLFYKIM